jgi:putative NIF3 family GTP cyclohydrolase 1 type 2
LAFSKQKSNRINRREFIKSSATTVLAASTLSPLLSNKTYADTKKRGKNMICRDLDEHFRKIGTWVNWDKTTDTFKAGEATKPVKKVAVAWKASWDAMKEAVSRGADLFISHESICVNAVNGSPEPEKVFALPSEKPKFDWLEKTGLVVYRCHNVWDRFPKEGIRDTWQRELKLGNKIIADEYPRYVTEVDPISLGDLTRHILKRIKPLKENGVLVTGDMSRMVSKIGTGTGVTVDPEKFYELGADVGIMTDDYYTHVRSGVLAQELDFPTIFVNHGVSEEWGIQNLASYLKRIFPELEVFHIPQYCPYKMVVNDDF